MHDWKGIRKEHGKLVFHAIFRILNHHDQALDCYQEVFLEVFERYREQAVLNWPALLRRIAVHRALDRLRKERRVASRISSNNDISMLPATGEESCDGIEFRELIDRVRLEVARLPLRQGEAFWLRCVEEFSTAEVADLLGTDVNSVGVLVHRARTRLRELLADVNPTQAIC